MKAIQILTGCCLVLLLVGFFNVNTRASMKNEEFGSSSLAKKLSAPMDVYVEGSSDAGKLGQQVKEFVLGESNMVNIGNARRFLAGTPEDKSAIVYATIGRVIQNEGKDFLNNRKINGLSSSILSISQEIPDEAIGGRGRFLRSIDLFGAFLIEVLAPGLGDKLFAKAAKSGGSVNSDGTAVSAEKEPNANVLDSLGMSPF